MIISDMSSVQCWNCGIIFGMPNSYIDKRRSDHNGFYCPNGHQNAYKGKSKEEILQEELDQKNAKIARCEATETRLRDELATEERRRRSLKGKVTLIRNRVARGACPCCRSKFPDLENHMKTKHPNYTKGKKVKA